MRNLLPAALAIPLLAVAGMAMAAAPTTKSTAHAGTAVPKHTRKLDLSPPNFASAEWQRRLQGPTIDHSLDYAPIESVVVRPGDEHLPYASVAPAGLGSVYWALTHPTQSWRVLMPVQPGDEFNADREIAMAYSDPLSSCPGFPGTLNVRPVCN